MSLEKYATFAERRIAEKLVGDILAAGMAVSVDDGGGFPVKRSTDGAAILGALATSGEDTLIIRGADGERVGFVSLIWGNECDLISDHTASPALDSLVKGASDLADKLG